MDEESAPIQEKLPEEQKPKLLSTKVLVAEQFSFTEEVRRPVKIFMSIAGLHDGQGGRFLNWYRRIVVTVLVFSTIRRATQITLRPPGSQSNSVADIAFDPIVVLSLVVFLYTLSGLVCFITMERIYKMRKSFLEKVDKVMLLTDCRKEMRYARRRTKFLIILILLLSSVGATMDTLWKLGHFNKDVPFIPPLVSKNPYFLPLEIWLTFVLQSAISTQACDFFISCNFLRYMVAGVRMQMNRNFRDSPPLIKLQHLDDIQTHHHYLLGAQQKLDECYSFIIFCFYGCSIPCVCFLSYVAYRNAGNANPGVVFAMGAWIFGNISDLMILSWPAFQVTEEGEYIAKSAFNLYHSCLKGEDDPRILSQMLILISQIQSNPISISAYNYFPINRGILLTMFSAIFTYFLILVQFGNDKEPKNVTAELLKAIEICKNFSLLNK